MAVTLIAATQRPTQKAITRGRRAAAVVGMLAAGLHAVCERLGGLTRRWRFDRMATVCHPVQVLLECPVTGISARYDASDLGGPF